jgi:hypothetical protein
LRSEEASQFGNKNVDIIAVAGGVNGQAVSAKEGSSARN